MSDTIGRLMRSSTAGYVFGCSVPEPDVPCFGDFVKVLTQRGQTPVFGIIYNLVIQDDPFVRQLVAVDDLEDAYILDQRMNRQVPIEVSVLAIGYRGRDGQVVLGLPPQPPITLDRIHSCSTDEILECTAQPDYVRLLLNSPEAPADELVPVVVRHAAQARPPQDRAVFLRSTGRALARWLARDLTRLETLLQRIKP